MELTVKYDDHVLSAAAISLFLHRWRPFLPWPAGVLTTLAVLVGVLCLFRGLGEIAALLISLGVLSVVAWLVLFARHRALVMNRSGEVARVLIGERIVRLESASGVAEVPWSAVLEIEVGCINVLLFMARGVAIILPAASLPSAVVEIIDRKRRSPIRQAI